MTVIGAVASEQVRLASAVHAVRQRWRLKHALRGAAITVGIAFVALVAASYLLQWAHDSDSAVLAARLLFAGGMAGMVAWLVVRPLRALPPDAAVALYAEEHGRLGATLVTAVDLSGREVTLRSPTLAARVIRAALDGLQQRETPVDQRELWQSGLVLSLVLAVAIAATWFGPQTLRSGARLLLVPFGGEPAGAYAIDVRPRNATIARGGDQMVTATLRGFDAEHVELLVRAADSANWTRLPMTVDSSGRYAFRLFDIVNRTRYAVEASGIRSPAYMLRALFDGTANNGSEYRGTKL